MRIKLLAILIIAALALGGFHLVSAASNPAIITFESSLTEVSVNELEAGTVTTTLSWDTVGMGDEYRLTLASYIFDRWEMVFSDTAVPLQANGEVTVTVQPPLSFSPPTFLLSIVRTRSSSIVAQRVLSIPYAEPSGTPIIDAFDADLDTLDRGALVAGTARVNLSWEVTNRTPTSNLVFEQVFEDGTAVSVELPRPNLWVPSVGSGPVAPVYKAGEEAVMLRLSVIDLLSDTVLAEEELSLALTGAAEPPTLTPTLVPPPASETIVSFTATPSTVNRGAPVSLAWEVRGTGGVVIEQTVPGQGDTVTTVVNAQSPQGSATVYLPDYAAYSVQFTLRTINPPATKQVTVQVHCPYTFFFGEGDGCPSTQAKEVGASYQAFEDGYMIWRSDTNEIYVHYDDGTAAYFLESSYAWMSEPSLDTVPPLDRQAPVSGFGKVWANAPGVKDKLGWALDAELGYTTEVQSVAPARTPRPEFATYFTLPDGKVIGTGYGRWREIE